MRQRGSVNVHPMFRMARTVCRGAKKQARLQYGRA